MERWSTFSIISMMGAPVVTGPPVRSSSKTPERIFTWSGSWRWVVKRDWPGRRLSRKDWISSAVRRNVGRAAVDDAADGGAMAFAEGGDAEEMAEGVVRHERLPKPHSASASNHSALPSASLQ